MLLTLLLLLPMALESHPWVPTPVARELGPSLSLLLLLLLLLPLLLLLL